MRILYGSNPIGLGHAVRDSIVLSGLRDRGIQADFVSGKTAARFIKDLGFVAHAYYEAPLFKVKEGHVQDTFPWMLEYLRFHRKAKEILRESFDWEAVDLVIADEDFATAAVAFEERIPVVFVTDILEFHFARSPLSRLLEGGLNRQMRRFLRKSELVLFPEKGKDLGNLHYIGPMVRAFSGPREEVRRRCGFRRPTILVTAGGTDLGLFLLKKAVEVFEHLKLPDTDLVIALGPSIHDVPWENHRLLGYVPNLHDYVLAADLVIAQAGKSSTDEALAAGTPLIAIPLEGHSEQEENARGLGYSFQDLDRLPELISSRLGKRNPPVAPEGNARFFEILEPLLGRLPGKG